MFLAEPNQNKLNYEFCEPLHRLILCALSGFHVISVKLNAK